MQKISTFLKDNFVTGAEKMWVQILSIGTVFLLYGMIDIIFGYDIINAEFEFAMLLGLGLWIAFDFVWMHILDMYIYPMFRRQKND